MHLLLRLLQNSQVFNSVNDYVIDYSVIITSFLRHNLDTTSALKQLSNAAYQPVTNPNRAQIFAQKAVNFTECSQRLAGLGRMAAPQLVCFPSEYF